MSGWDSAKRWVLPLLLVAALLGLWQLATSTEAIVDALSLEVYLVPSPAEVATALWENRALLAENAWVTGREVLLGIACALVAGLGCALALHLSPTLRTAAYPLIVASQTVPIPVIAPILVIWFGFGILPKLAIVALISFFPIVVNTLDGLGSVDPEARKMMRSLDASRTQILRRLEAPSALPSVFSGVKIAVAVAVIGAVFAEWSGSEAGLGRMIQLDLAHLETARIFAAVAVLSAMAIGLFGLLTLIERRVVTWR